MSTLLIRWFARDPDGRLFDLETEMGLDQVGGHIPAVGDQVVDPSLTVEGQAKDWTTRSIWMVRERFFRPKDSGNHVVLVVEERAASMQDDALF